MPSSADAARAKHMQTAIAELRLTASLPPRQRQRQSQSSSCAFWCVAPARTSTSTTAAAPILITRARWLLNLHSARNFIIQNLILIWERIIACTIFWLGSANGYCITVCPAVTDVIELTHSRKFPLKSTVFWSSCINEHHLDRYWLQIKKANLSHVTGTS